MSKIHHAWLKNLKCYSKDTVSTFKSIFCIFLLHFWCILTILHYFLQCFAWNWVLCSNMTKMSIWCRKIFFRQQQFFFSKNICLKTWNMVPGHYRPPGSCHFDFGPIGHFGLQFYTTFFSVLKNAFSDTKNFPKLKILRSKHVFMT